jgi:hypothetical protein
MASPRVKGWLAAGIEPGNPKQNIAVKIATITM